MFNTKTLDNTQVHALVDSYKDGKATLTSIAKDLGCSIPTVSRLLKRNGLTLRAKGRPKGSKTVNRKPKVTTVGSTNVVAASVPENVDVKAENLASNAVDQADAFSAFQQKVMAFSKTA